MAHGRDTTEGSDESKKMKPSNCCNSSAAHCVSENADSICKQSNKETSETQDIFSLNFCRRFYVRKKRLHREPTKNYFPLPNGIYQLGLSAGTIAVYGYMLYIENRETYLCHASYATIGNAVGMSRNTVRKYVQELEQRRLILTERTTIVTRDRRIQNGSLRYTIRPIQLVIEQFYQEQFKAADITREQQRIERLMAEGS